MEKKNQKWTMAALFLGLLEILFVNAMASVVGPNIVADLNGTSLFAFMYTLTFLCTSLSLPITSMIGNKTGRKKVILVGVAIYGVSSVFCGLSANMVFHVLMRGLQGIGNGCILGNVLAFFGEYLDEENRAKAMGFYGTLTGIVYLAAPLVGGIISDSIGWRIAFESSIPLTVCVFAILLIKMPDYKPKTDNIALDGIGAILLSGVTVGIVMAFSWGGQTYAWTSIQVLGMIALCIACFILFIKHINKVKNPIISPKLFENREFCLVIGSVVLIGPTMYAIGSYLSMQSMAICGTNATVAGGITAAKSAVQLALGYFIGSYIGKTGKVKSIMILTSAVYTISNVLLGLVSSPADLILFIIGILLSGLGTTTYSIVYTLHAQNELPEKLVGEATSAIQFLQSLSGTIGLSIVGMVLNISFENNLKNVIPAGLTSYISSDVLKGYLNTSLLTDAASRNSILNALDASGAELFNTFLLNLRTAYASAMRNAMFILALFALITLIFALMVKAKKKNK